MKSYTMKRVKLGAGFKAIARAFVPADTFLRQLRAAQRATANAISTGNSPLVPVRIGADDTTETFEVAFPFRATITERTLAAILEAGGLDSDQIEVTAHTDTLLTAFRIRFVFTAPIGAVENFTE